ncbi:MAG: hypothetical protein LWW98_08985 [Deltaproteobacteria bacterium]|nr:hypothetical protein [Deltaproteobacteria bacterium]
MFIGRKEELQHLQRIIKSNKSLIGIVYGRRRIGNLGVYPETKNAQLKP